MVAVRRTTCGNGRIASDFQMAKVGSYFVGLCVYDFGVGVVCVRQG